MVVSAQRCALAMHQSGTGRFCRKLAAGLAAYVIALQAAVSGLGLAALAASPHAPPPPICGEHAADPAGGPSRPASDPSLCPCAATCMATGCNVLSDAAAIAALAPGVVLPAALSRCGSPAAQEI